MTDVVLERVYDSEGRPMWATPNSSQDQAHELWRVKGGDMDDVVVFPFQEAVDLALTRLTGVPGRVYIIHRPGDPPVLYEPSA